jgi:cell division protein FtsA
MSKQRLVTSIDIGSSKVATIIAQQSEESGHINVVGAASVESKGIRKGIIVNIEEATQAVIDSVEAAERMAGVNVGKVWVNVSGNHLESQNSHGVVAVSEPEGEITPADIQRVVEAAQAIQLHANKEILHVLPMQFTVDNQDGIRDPVGMTGVRLEVNTHVITGSSTAIRNLYKCVSEIGANVEDLVFSGLASAYAVLSETEKELGVVLVDIGGGTTDIAMYVEGSLAYSSVLPVGAKNVTNDLAIGLRVSLESAEQIKLVLGKDFTDSALPEDGEGVIGKTKEERKSVRERARKRDLVDLSKLGIKEEIKDVSRKTMVEGIIKPRLDEIFYLVSQEIKKSGLSHMVPSGLVLCGGGAMTVGAISAAKRSLSLPVRLGEPHGLYGLIDDISNPAYATGLGLILYALKDDDGESVGFGLQMPRASLPKVPLKGALGKVVNLIRSFLP